MADVALIGFGRFGRALGEMLADAGMSFVAFDPYVEVPDEVSANSLRECAERAKLIVLGTPVPRMRTTLEALAPHLGEQHVVFDVGSVKMGPSQAMQTTLGQRVPWVATHPLFGPVSLALAERPLRVVLCPNPLFGSATQRVRALYERIGCEIVEQTAEEHDRVMAHTHAITFFVAKGMMDAGAGASVPFAPPSFQAIARTIEAVRSDAGHLFVAIQNENPFAREARAELVQALTHIHQALEEPSARLEEPASQAVLAIPDLGSRSVELREAREHIDAIDQEIVALLARRSKLAERAMRAKQSLGAPVLDGQREALVFERRRAWANELGLEEEGVEEVFRSIVRFSRRIQSKAR